MRGVILYFGEEGCESVTPFLYLANSPVSLAVRDKKGSEPSLATLCIDIDVYEPNTFSSRARVRAIQVMIGHDLRCEPLSSVFCIISTSSGI